MKSAPGRLVEIASEAFESVESSGEFIGCDFTLLPRFLLSGEFPMPSSATDDEILWCRNTGLLGQSLRFRYDRRRVPFWFSITVSVRRRMKAGGVCKLELAIRSGTTPECYGVRE
jgi:hypothetical protein